MSDSGSKMPYSFEVKDLDIAGRIGQFKLGKKSMETPNLFPVVAPFENSIPPKRMYDQFGARAIFTNAYIIFRNQIKHQKIMEQKLHAALNFPGIIATDSGAFQDYMYGQDKRLKAEEIEPFQEQIGSDCPVILDLPVQTTDSFEVAQNKVYTTIARAKENVQRRIRKDTAWFGPIHGSIYPELLKYSCEQMSQLEFGIYAIGGVVKTFIDYRFDLDVKILLQVRQWLTPNRPLHMFGLGLPNFFALAVACGADTFDSAAYYLYAEDGRYFTLQGTKNIADLTELPCHCPICTSHTVSEIKTAEKNEQIRLLAEHNLYLSFSELRAIRQAIREGTLWELVEQRVRAHPKLIKALQKTQGFLPFLEEISPTDKVRGIKYLSAQSFYRPEVYRYHKKLSSLAIKTDKQGIICIPELDLPGLNAISLQQWLQKISKLEKYSLYQVMIVSNLFGFIPLEIADIYPLSQHEGSPCIRAHDEETTILWNSILRLLQKNMHIVKDVLIFIPKEYNDEYNEKRPFNSNNHLIGHLQARLKQEFPTINIEMVSEIDEFNKFL